MFLTNGKEPLEWIVLKTEGDRAMLITRYLIDARAYHKAFVKMTWSECTLRQWLNDTFLKEAFSQEEQARIEEVLVVNDDNPHYSTRGGEDTMDRVFLLSEAEVLEFFPEQEQRTCQATEYAKAQGAYVDENNGNSWWWLRSPGVPARGRMRRARGRAHQRPRQPGCEPSQRHDSPGDLGNHGRIKAPNEMQPRQETMSWHSASRAFRLGLFFYFPDGAAASGVGVESGCGVCRRLRRGRAGR